MDTLLAIATRREERDYSEREIPETVVNRILMAGRATGSAMNRQPCRFTSVPRRHDQFLATAELVTRPTNISGAALIIVVTLTIERAVFDAGRACQNMMLAAWSEGIGSCPNSIKNPDGLKTLLGSPLDEHPVTILSFGFPARDRDLEARSPGEWMNRLDRLPEEQVVRRL